MKNNGFREQISYKIFIFLVTSFFLPPSWAFYNVTPVLTLTGGVDVLNSAPAQHLTLIPPYQNYYTKTNHQKRLASFGVLIGFESILHEHISYQGGIAGYIDERLHRTGEIWQFNLPLFNDFTYQYAVDHQRLMFSNKLLLLSAQYVHAHPYILFELGGAMNFMRHYVQMPRLLDVVSPDPFKNHRSFSFSYGAGLGVDFNMTPHLRWGVGYQYSDLGRGALGKMPGALTNESLRFSHMEAHQFRGQLTYLR